MTRFHKITPVNGFDANDPNNAKQNNYAWSMEEMDDYLYVGTGRNIAYLALRSFGLEVPKILTPNPVDLNAEIWRYRKDGSEEWERVYKAPPELGVFGFRFMIRYTTPAGETALYAGAYTTRPPIIILKSTNGVDWRLLTTNIPGTSTRMIVIYQGRLYMAVLSEAIGGEPLLYESTDPEREGWTQVNLTGKSGKNPRGPIVTMIPFNNQLYLGTSPPGGLEVWRTTRSTPLVDQWKLVIDQGAGDALNEVPLTLGAFRDRLYVGSAIALAISSTDPAKKYVPPKGADLITVNNNDRWRIIAGSDPIAPTTPITGTRNQGKYPSGFGDLSNAYIWQLLEHQGRFYLGTFDWSDLIGPLLGSLITMNRGVVEKIIAAISEPATLLGLAREYQWGPWLESLLHSIPTLFFTMGFDFYESEDGVNWEPISLDGLNNPHNYGLRTLLSASDGKLYLGTANPFEGCEVWVTD